VIILDTNVISALMREEPEQRVVRWLDQQPAQSVWITSITLFEARFGIALLTKGKRQRALEVLLARLVQEDLENRIADFDATAAGEAATLAAARQKAGRHVDLRDTQIAGIAVARRAALATRNTKHFQGLKISVIDPWKA
jgi:predicted nucleic acid-binding protein